jgi:hypothetical protein
MKEAVLTGGQLASAIMAVMGLIAYFAGKPIMARIKARKARIEADRAAQAEFQRQVLDGIKSIGEHVGDLQCDRLTAAHDHFMALGYCPDTTKQWLCDMHRSYKSKGRNHIADSYEADIISLPSQELAKTD